MISMPIISEIRWDRVYLNLKLAGAHCDSFEYLVSNNTTGENYPLSYKNQLVSINITNVTPISGQEMLASGDWTFTCKEPDGSITPLLLDSKAYKSLEILDKVFPYWEGAYSYTVNFVPMELDALGLTCVMQTSYMRKNNKPHKEYILLETNSFPAAVKKATVLLTSKIFRGIYRILNTLTRKDGKHILLMSETKSSITGNLQSLDARLKARNLDRNLKISYSFHETLNLSSIRVAAYWFKLMFMLAKQDFVFIDDYAPVFKMLNLKRTKLIQVWHAGLGFKSVAYSRFGKQDSPRPLDSCHRKYDYVVVGSKNLVPVYQEVFGLSADKFLPLGVPRIDTFLSQDTREEYKRYFYEKYPQLKGKKLILFGPTYRGAGQTHAYYPYEKLDLDKIFDFCSEHSVFVLKMHPFIQKKIEIPEKYKNKIIDLSSESINDMLNICDVLITDYSSVIYEFVLLDRPILFYSFDKEIYEATRGFHWDYDTYAPGKICTSFTELITALEKEDYEAERINAFKTFAFDHIDTNSCDRLIDHLLIQPDDHGASNS